ncbi:MAG: YcxB family protein [Mangrovibacterium sp.]
MEMITTGKIKLTSQKLFRILIRVYLRKRWWLLVWVWVLLIILLLMEKRDVLTNFLIVFMVLSQIFLVAQYWFYSHSKDNKVFFLSRYYEIDKEKIVGFLEDGTSTPIKIEHFIRVIKIDNYNLLYLSKMQFIYLPKECFTSETDRQWFEEEVLSKIGKKDKK